MPLCACGGQRTPVGCCACLWVSEHSVSDSRVGGLGLQMYYCALVSMGSFLNLGFLLLQQKHYDPKASWGGKGLFDWYFHFSSKEIRTGTLAGEEPGGRS